MVATSTQDLNTGTPTTKLAPRQRLRDTVLLLAVLAAGATAVIFGLQYQATERSNEAARWSARLDNATLAAASNIGRIAEAQSASLIELADNASLRLYLWALLNRGDISRDVPAAEFDYLRGLLSAYTDSGTRSRTGSARFNTLALLDAQLSTVLTTPGAATTAEALQIAQQAITTRTRQLVLSRSADGEPLLFMAVVVEPPPGAAGKQAIGGVLVSATRAGDLLQPVIKSIPGYFDNDTNLLLAASGDPVVLLSGSDELAGLQAMPTLGYARTVAASGAPVLQSTQRVPATGWQLLRRIDARQAQAAVQQRVWAYFAALGMSVVLLATLLWAWRERSIRMQERKTYLPMLIGQHGRAATREEQLLNKLVTSLVDIIDLHDPYSAFHSARLAELCRAIGTAMGLDQTSLHNLVTAAMLANVGKISLPRELLTKRDELSGAEQHILQTHVSEGVEILRNLDIADPILTAIAQKQEHLDGSGYPHGLAADRITLPGRILAVANAYIALVSPRAYRDALTREAALDALRTELGRTYDPAAFAALEQVLESGEGITDWDFPTP